MPLLIDGYNLLHVTGILPRGFGPRTLEQARTSLLNQIAARLDKDARLKTTIVFDAQAAPADQPEQFQHQELTVRFAVGYPEADDLLEELIRTHPTPKQLTVVSSDRRVQKAARRRRAQVTDSEVWFAQLKRLKRHSATSDAIDQPSVAPPDDSPPDPTLGNDEVARWINEFAVDPNELASLQREFKSQAPATQPPQVPASKDASQPSLPNSPADSTNHPASTESQPHIPPPDKQKQTRHQPQEPDFSDDPLLAQFEDLLRGAPDQPRDRDRKLNEIRLDPDERRPATRKPKQLPGGADQDVFPPGYGMDLLDDEDDDLESKP